MKSLKITIATICFAIIGVGIFISCEKETVNDNPLVSNSNKIQKDMSDAFYEYVDEPGVYYWANDPERKRIEGLPGGWEDPKKINTRGEGSVEHSSYGTLIDIHCKNIGTTCGDAEQKCGDVVRTGIWVIYQDPYNGGQWAIAYKWD